MSDNHGCMCGFIRHCPIHGDLYADAPPLAEAAAPRPVGHVPLGCEADDCPTPDLCRGIGCQASYARKAAEAEAAAGDPDITAGVEPPPPPAEAQEETWNAIRSREHAIREAAAQMHARCVQAVERVLGSYRDLTGDEPIHETLTALRAIAPKEGQSDAQ